MSVPDPSLARSSSPSVPPIVLATASLPAIPPGVFNLEDGVAEANARINEMLKTATRPLVVFVAGGSATGKTDLVAKKISGNFSAVSLPLTQDDYQKGNVWLDNQRALGRYVTWDHPEFSDYDLLRQHLKELIAGNSIIKPIYNFKTGGLDSSEMVHPKPLIVVEGIFALRDEIQDMADLRIFVDTSTHGRLIRRLMRDIHRSSLNPQRIIQYFAKAVEPLHQQYIQPTSSSAEIFINNDYNAHVESHRAGGVDLQLKFKGTLDPAILAKEGAVVVRDGVERDRYLERPDHPLDPSHEVVRIRDFDGKHNFTYKGPKVAGTDQRWRFDLELEAGTVKAIESLYPVCRAEVVKNRKDFQVGGLTVSVDTNVTLSKNGASHTLGDYFEVRCPKGDMPELTKTLARWGLRVDDAVKIHYAS
jgi:uridine kinase